MNKKIILCAFFFLTITVGYAQTSLPQALKKAKQENKLVLIDCYFTGCIPCEQMDRDVFPNPVVKQELESNFVFVKANIFTEKLGDTLKVQHILNGFPTFLVMNGDGQLVTNTSGFKDPGDLMQLLADAKTKAKNKLFLSGYATQYDESLYPKIYTEFAKTRKGLSKETLASYSSNIQDFKANYALLPFLIARNTNEQVSAAILKDYTGFASTYGVEVLQPVVDRALAQQVESKLTVNSTEKDFDNFLDQHKQLFPASQWKICLQTIGDKYFLGMKKDTTGYLKLMAKNPVIHQYYFNSIYGNMMARKQFNPERFALFLQWANGAVTAESSMEIIKTAANIAKSAGKLNDYKKFLQMAVDKAKKYQMSYTDLEAQLNKAS